MSGKTILFIEDEDLLRELGVCVLEEGAHKVLTAGTSEDALKIWDSERDKIDLVITDIIIPGESGLDLARKFRRDRPDLKIIFITGSVERSPEIESFGGNAEGLFKPAALQLLGAAVRRVLG
jgi:DNA-binding response OmpR family regulator